MKTSKLIKNKCEIESCDVCIADALHFHHIIERTKVNTTNNPMNLAILCATHHELVHSGHLKIIGIFPSTKLPNKRTLVYELDGKKNIDIDVPYIEFKNKSFKVCGDN
jgi:hypothetical protein